MLNVRALKVVLQNSTIFVSFSSHLFGNQLVASSALENIYAVIGCFNALSFGHQKNNLVRLYRDYQFISGEIYPIIGRFRPYIT